MSTNEQINVTTDYHFSMVPEWVFERLKHDSLSLVLYVFLSMKVYGDRGWAMSRQSIADALGWSVKTVDRKTKELVEDGVLVVRKTRQPSGEQGWNEYVVLRQSPSPERLHSRHQRDCTVAPVGTGQSPIRIHKYVKGSTKTPPTPPEGGTPKGLAECVVCHVIGERGTEVVRVRSSTPGTRSVYAHPGCKVTAVHLSQPNGRMTSSYETLTDPEDWT